MYRAWIESALWATLGLGLWWVPPETWTHLPSFCLWRACFGVDCPGCGMGRALIFLLHGRVTEALAFHPLSPLVAGIFAFALARRLRRLWKGAFATGKVRKEVGGGTPLAGSAHPKVDARLIRRCAGPPDRDR